LAALFARHSSLHSFAAFCRASVSCDAARPAMSSMAIVVLNCAFILRLLHYVTPLGDRAINADDIVGAVTLPNLALVCR